jgi:hypothetical protein
MAELLALTADDVARIEHRARRAGQPSWTGTAGTVAADVMRLLAERQRLLVQIARLEEQRDHWRIRGD